MYIIQGSYAIANNNTYNMCIKKHIFLMYLNDSIKKTLAQNQFRSFEISLGVSK